MNEHYATDVLVVFKRQFLRKLGAEHGSVLLVRPDGYLAFHKLGLDRDGLTSELGDWVLGAPPTDDPGPRSEIIVGFVKSMEAPE